MSHQIVAQEKTHNHIMFGTIQSDYEYLRIQFEKGCSLHPKQLQVNLLFIKIFMLNAFTVLE